MNAWLYTPQNLSSQRRQRIVQMREQLQIVNLPIRTRESYNQSYVLSAASPVQRQHLPFAHESVIALAQILVQHTHNPAQFHGFAPNSILQLVRVETFVIFRFLQRHYGVVVRPQPIETFHDVRLVELQLRRQKSGAQARADFAEEFDGPRGYVVRTQGQHFPQIIQSYQVRIFGQRRPPFRLQFTFFYVDGFEEPLETFDSAFRQQERVQQQYVVLEEISVDARIQVGFVTHQFGKPLETSFAIRREDRVLRKALPDLSRLFGTQP